MGLKRTKKRKNSQPNSRVSDFGFDTILSKLDKSIKILDNKPYLIDKQKQNDLKKY